MRVRVKYEHDCDATCLSSERRTKEVSVIVRVSVRKIMEMKMSVRMSVKEIIEVKYEHDHEGEGEV